MKFGNLTGMDRSLVSIKMGRGSSYTKRSGYKTNGLCFKVSLCEFKNMENWSSICSTILSLDRSVLAVLKTT